MFSKKPASLVILRFIYCLSILAVVLCLILNLNLLKPVKVEAALSYQRTITVVNSSGSTQTNYSIQFSFDTASLISLGKMRSDCGDIRVRDTNQTTDLSYFLDSGCNTSNTIVWARIPTLATGTRILYLFYGDPTVVSASTSGGVIDIYETMQVAPSCNLLNSATWDSVNKWVVLTTAIGGDFGQCEYSYSPGTGFYIKYEFWSGGGNGADANWVYAYERTTPNAEDIIDRGYHFTYDEYQSRICFTKSVVDNGAGIACGTSTTIDNSTWHTAEVYHSGRLGIMLMDGVQFVNASDNVTVNKSNSRFGIGARTGGLFNEHRIRRIVMTKYNAGVTVSLGTERNLFNTLAFTIRNSTDTADTNLCNLGTVTTSATATCSYRLKVSTNASNGYVVYMRASGNFVNGSNALTNAAAGPSGSDISAATLNTERYGATITPGSISSGTISATSLFNAGTNAVQYNYTTNTNILSATGLNLPNNTDTVRTSLVTHKLNIAGDTPSGYYTQNITYGVVPSF